MIFIYKKWDKFCRDLKNKDIISVPAKELLNHKGPFLVLKHDIENTVYKSYKLAEIENYYGHRGTYYIHAHLLKDSNNVELLKKMQKMGHEISYHHDVMDSNHGNIDNAIIEFNNNKNLFEKLGFCVTTVCQHGNPIIERKGYTSNRDFFRNDKVQKLYPNISDIMVNYKEKHNIDYEYYSDAGRKFKLIYDPINNDRIKSDDKNISYETLDEIIKNLDSMSKIIISTHPHRWTNSVARYILKDRLFKIIKGCAKLLIHIPICKKIMSKYYYLAKKI